MRVPMAEFRTRFLSRLEGTRGIAARDGHAECADYTGDQRRHRAAWPGGGDAAHQTRSSRIIAVDTGGCPPDGSGHEIFQVM